MHLSTHNGWLAKEYAVKLMQDEIRRFPFLPWLIVLFTVALIALGHYVYLFDKDRLSLHCSADAFIAKSNTEMQLELQIEAKGGNLSMDYHFFEQGHPVGEISLKGVLETLQYGDMTYKARIDQGDFNIDLTSLYVPPYMQNIIDFSRKRMLANSSIDVNVRVLVTDSVQDYSIIQILPGEAIWACKHQQ
ncbi:hypothetical protein [Shewanella waksmanii]|uniref:hypothetical protein n=1 Tax=Shewanella waksmanii TaxID=213783 RepID=UPI0037362766